jgi:hypothetical protein
MEVDGEKDAKSAARSDKSREVRKAQRKHKTKKPRNEIAFKIKKRNPRRREPRI